MWWDMLIALGAGILAGWLALLVALVLMRPKGALLAEAVRLLPVEGQAGDPGRLHPLPRERPRAPVVGAPEGTEGGSCQQRGGAWQ